MSRSIERRLQRLEGRFNPEELAERRAQAALDRIFLGTATWSDFALLGQECVAGLRAELMVRLPLALAHPTREGHRTPDPWTIEPVLRVLTVPEFDDRPADVVGQINTFWREATDVGERLRWAGLRLALGEDDGRALHASCWDIRGGQPVLSEPVLRSAHGQQLGGWNYREVVGYGDYRELAEAVLNPEEHDFVAARKANERYWDARRYFQPSLLEAAILWSSECVPAWLGESGACWWAGQIRSDSVTSRSARVDVRAAVRRHMVSNARDYMDRLDAEPKPWRKKRADSGAAASQPPVSEPPEGA